MADLELSYVGISIFSYSSELIIVLMNRLI